MRKLTRDPEVLPRNDTSQHAIADVAKKRACLTCRTEFDSSGFGERICKRCKSKSPWRSGHAASSTRR